MDKDAHQKNAFIENEKKSVLMVKRYIDFREHLMTGCGGSNEDAREPVFLRDNIEDVEPDSLAFFSVSFSWFPRLEKTGYRSSRFRIIPSTTFPLSL